MRLSDLKEDPRNPREITDLALAGLSVSIEAFGDLAGIVFNKTTGELVAGHQRVKAIRDKFGDLDITDAGITTPSGEVFKVRFVEWEREKQLAANVAANNTATQGTFNDDLQFLLAEIQEDDGDLYEALLLDQLEQPSTDPTEDDVGAETNEAEELQERWGTAEGQLWVIEGNAKHRLACGDSTKQDVVGRLLDDAVPFIMVTDPPYGVEYDPTWRNDAANKGLISYGAKAVGEVQNDGRVDWSDAYILFSGNVAYVWHAGRFAADLVLNLRSADFSIRSQIIWRKMNFAISRGHYHWQHEPCWYAVRKGSSKWCGDRSQSTVWDIDHTANETGHSTQKPVECMARPIRNHGDKSDSVYDPFLGSGTTMVAAEKLGRSCYGVELSPQYVAVILERMTNIGCKPRLVED